MEEELMGTTERNVMSAKDRLSRIEAERRELRAQVSKEEAERLAKAAENRKVRDTKIEEVALVLVKVQKEIFIYNRSGIRLKGKNDILNKIANLVEDPNAKEIATVQVEESIVNKEPMEHLLRVAR